MYTRTFSTHPRTHHPPSHLFPTYTPSSTHTFTPSTHQLHLQLTLLLALPPFCTPPHQLQSELQGCCRAVGQLLIEARKRRVGRSDKHALTDATKREELLKSLVVVHSCSVTNELLKGAVGRSVDLRKKVDDLPGEVREKVESVTTAAGHLLSRSKSALEAGSW